MDKGKGKMIEPEKPKKAAAFPLQTGGVFKIYDTDPAPPASVVAPSVQRARNPIEAPRVARVLKLVDEEEEVEAEKPVEVASVPAPKISNPREDSEVEVIEAPLMRKRTLTKAVDVAAPGAIPTAAATMANFLAAWRKQAPPPSVPRMETIEAFLANEPIEAVPVTVVGPIVEQPL
jgi:hypothetical protein